MHAIRELENAPTLVQLCRDVRAQDDGCQRRQVFASNLELDPGGLLILRGGSTLNGTFAISPDAARDLARLAEIPLPFFQDLDRELRATCVNRRLGQKVPGSEPLQAVVRDQAVDRILKTSLLPVPRLPVLDTILNAIPENVNKDAVRAIQYAWNGTFDVSAISPSLTCQPRVGDVVAFGVNVSEGTDGSVQVQGAAFRLLCSNGAVTRICDGRYHRIRRPINRPDRENELLQDIARFAREAWNQWPASAEGLRNLDAVGLGAGLREALVSRLRQAPFFLSLRAVNQVLERLEIEQFGRNSPATLYDLFNAMSYVGTHETGFSGTHRMRLRFGAGEFIRHQSRLCATCRQLILERGTMPRPPASSGEGPSAQGMADRSSG